MTDLTEQWKKGELPSGWYYIKCDDEIFVDYYEEEIVDLETNETEKSWRNYFGIVEVLAPVPSYDEYWHIRSCLNDQALILNENIKLKELLKECRNSLEEQSNVRKLYESDVEYRDRYNKKMDLLIKLDEVLK